MSLFVDGTGKIVVNGSGGAFVTAPGGSTTVQHGQTFTLLATGGTGFGLKDNAPTPQVFDDGSDAAVGSTSTQFNAAGSKFPTAAGGVLNIQNQLPGFSPVRTFITPINKFIRKVTSGATAFNGTNDSNAVYLGVYATLPNNGTTATLPASTVYEYDICYDPDTWHDPQGDDNVKLFATGDGNQVWANPPNDFIYSDPFPINQFCIVGFTQANPCVVTIGTKQAGNPFTSGKVPAFFGYGVGAAGASHPINGLFANGGMTAAGSNGAFTLTLTGVDSTAWPAFAAVIPISNMSNASQCVVTSTATTQPFYVGQTITPDGVTGMANGGAGTGVNRIPFVVASIGGSSGAWTAALNASGFGTAFDTSNTTNYPPYTGCTNGLYTGGASTPFSKTSSTYTGATNPFSQLEFGPASQTWANPIPCPWNPTTGTSGTMWHRLKVEYTWDTVTAASGGHGRIRLSFDNVILFDYTGRSDNLTAGLSYFTRWLTYGLAYGRSRSVNNFVTMMAAYFDWGGTVGQTARVYASDQSTWGVQGGIYEPQPWLTSWTDAAISGTFWQGKIPNTNGNPVYFYVLPQAVPTGTAPTIPAGSPPTLVATSLPTITTASVSGATHGVAYNSGSLTVTGGAGTKSWGLASATTGTAGIVNGYWTFSAQSGNTWTVNASTGAITGTPTVTGTDYLTVCVTDSVYGVDAKQYAVVIS